MRGFVGEEDGEMDGNMGWNNSRKLRAADFPGEVKGHSSSFKRNQFIPSGCVEFLSLAVCLCCTAVL